MLMCETAVNGPFCNWTTHRDISWETYSYSFFWMAMTRKYTGLSSAMRCFTDVSSASQIQWDTASERCSTVGKRLCMKKDLCVYSNVRSSDVPRMFVKHSLRHKYVPIADTYNEWLYLGLQTSEQCQRLTKSEGPPVWNGAKCDNAIRPSGKFLKFCRAESGYYCCHRTIKTAALVPHPVAIFITRFQHRNGTYYSFTLNGPQNMKKSSTSPRKQTIQAGGLTKITLMSGSLKGQFEDVIFFCSRNLELGEGEHIDYHYVSSKWCPYGWNIDFYMYGSLKQMANTQGYVATSLGPGSNLRTQLSAYDNVSMLSQSSFVFFGPKYSDGNHMKIYSEPTVMPVCGSQTLLRTSPNGIISSDEMTSSNTTTCRWKISAPSNCVVRIKFSRLNLSPPGDSVSSEVRTSLSKTG